MEERTSRHKRLLHTVMQRLPPPPHPNLPPSFFFFFFFSSSNFGIAVSTLIFKEKLPAADARSPETSERSQVCAVTSGRPEGLMGKGMKGRARARAPTVQTDRNSADVTRKERARGGGVRAHVPRAVAIHRTRKRTEDGGHKGRGCLRLVCPRVRSYRNIVFLSLSLPWIWRFL